MWVGLSIFESMPKHFSLFDMIQTLKRVIKFEKQPIPLQNQVVLQKEITISYQCCKDFFE